MKIVHLLPAFNLGGTEKMVANISRYLIGEGHQVKVLVFFPSSGIAYLPSEVETIYCKNTKLRRRFLRKSTVQLGEYNTVINEFRPDIIHSHSHYTDLVMLQGENNSARLFSHWHLEREQLDVSTTNAYERKRALTMYLDKLWLLEKFKHRNVKFLSISSYITDYHKNLFPKKLWAKINDLPNAIDLKYNEPDTKMPDDGKRMLRLISVGRLTNVKNHEFLINAAAQLLELNVKFKLDIYGDGELRDYLENLITTKNLCQFVALKGYTSEIDKILNNYDLYVHSAIKETFGLSILEAICAGLPVVSTNVGGIKDLVINDKNGILVEKDDLEGFVNAILKIANNSKLHQEMAQSGYEHSKKFGFDIYVEKLLNLYSEA